MTFRYWFATAAAGAALAASGPAAAAGSVSYDGVTQCAAFNLLLAQAYSGGVNAAAHKDEIELYTDQAAALMVVAATMPGNDKDAVSAEIKRKNDAMVALVSDEKAFGRLLDENLEACTNMGKAAKSVVDEQLGKQQ